MAPTSILLYCLFDRNTCQSLFHQVSCHSMNIPCFPIERNLAVSTCAVSIVYKGADVVEIRASTEIVVAVNCVPSDLRSVRVMLAAMLFGFAIATPRVFPRVLLIWTGTSTFVARFGGNTPTCSVSCPRVCTSVSVATIPVVPGREGVITA